MQGAAEVPRPAPLAQICYHYTIGHPVSAILDPDPNIATVVYALYKLHPTPRRTIINALSQLGKF